MKNAIKASILTSAIIALASVGAYAQTIGTVSGASATIGISATIASFDSISCNPFIDFNQYIPITNSRLTSPQMVSCAYASNDASLMDVTVYLPSGAPLTGWSGATIPNSSIWAGVNPDGLSPFQPLTDNLAGNDGLVVLNAIPPTSGDNLNFFLALNVPQNTLADTYSATLTVAITPELSFVAKEVARRRL